MQVAFELRGLTSLLMHADDVEAADSLMEWRKNPKNKNLSVAGDDRSPAWTWQTYLYTDGENVVMPADNLMVCLRQASAQLIMKKQKTFKEVSQSGMLVAGEFMEFRFGKDDRQLSVDDLQTMRDLTFKEQSEAARKCGFRLFTKRARVGSSKHVRVRPRFDQWSIHGVLDVMAPEITYDVLAQMFGLAGRVGLSDWRPGCKTPGSFGMFAAKLEKH